MKRLKSKYAAVMPDELPDHLPPSRGRHDHKIELTPDAQPPNQKYYRLSYEEQAECHRQIEDGLKKGFIRPSTSPWGSPVLFVKKKDGTMRMCIDFRAVNALTVKNRTALPRIDELLDQIKGSIFTSIDLRAGYNQIRMKEDSIPMTAFKTRWGLFEYTVLPFGLCNAPATFQTLINDVFREYLDQWMVCFLDDILIYSNSVEEHARHVEIVLKKLQDNQLYIKDSKCDWFQPEVKFLLACVGLKSGKARTSLQHRLPAETGREPGESRESNKTGVEQGDMQRKQLTGHASKRVYDWQSGMAHWGETQRYGSMGWPNGSAER